MSKAAMLQPRTNDIPNKDAELPSNHAFTSG